VGFRFRHAFASGLAVRYYHLLYFIYQYYRYMGWEWDAINCDFANTGWSDAAEYKWQANAAKLREWLGVSSQMPSAETASPHVRSVKWHGGAFGT